MASIPHHAEKHKTGHPFICSQEFIFIALDDADIETKTDMLKCLLKNIFCFYTNKPTYIYLHLEFETISNIWSF